MALYVGDYNPLRMLPGIESRPAQPRRGSAVDIPPPDCGLLCQATSKTTSAIGSGVANMLAPLTPYLIGVGVLALLGIIFMGRLQRL